jgi:hypothetical protein
MPRRSGRRKRSAKSDQVIEVPPGLAFAQLASYQHTLDFVTLSVLRNILVAWAAARGLLAEVRNSALIVCQLGRKPPHATRT